MPRIASRLFLFAFAVTLFILVCAQETAQAPTCEQVYKNITVSKASLMKAS